MSRLNLLSVHLYRNSRCLLSSVKSQAICPIGRTCIGSISISPIINCNRAIHVQSSVNAKKWSTSSITSGIDQIEWHTVYRFPLIVQARLFSRTKVYATIITSFSIPFVTANYLSGGCSINEMFIVFGITSFSTALLYAFGLAFRRLIGSIYLSPDQKLVRISHLTFFGNRQETVLRLTDITPLCDSNANLKDIFLCVSTDNVEALKYSLYMSLRFGGITDKEKFEQIFGSI